MGYLIKKSDKNAFNKVEYVKNATFWKDLLAFYDAYTLLTSRTKNELPDFCFQDGKLSLDGICLFIKDSTSIFTFASLNPSIEYLKLLYFAMANYSKDGELPHRNLISADYNKYRLACKSAVEKSKSLVGEDENKQQKAKDRVVEQNNNVKSLGNKIKLSNILLVFSLLIIAVGVLTFLMGDKLLKLTGSAKTLVSVLIISVGSILLVLSLIIKLKYGKKYKTEKGYSNNFISKQTINAPTNNLSKEKNIVYKLLSEQYEYKNNLAKNINLKFTNNFLMVLNTLKMNQKLYEGQYVITNAEMHEKDVREIISKLNAEKPNFNEIYKDISEKNWLYYSQLVRYKFISEFARNAILTHNWLIQVDDQKQHPFEIDIKKLVNEKVVFIPNSKDEVYVLPVEDIVKSSLLKKSNLQDFEKVGDTKTFRFCKNQYMTNFYDYRKYKNNEGGIEKMKFEDESIEKYSKIPTLFEIEEKLQNLQLNLENSSEKSINKTLAEIYGNMLGFADDYIDSVLPENAIDSDNLLTSENEIDDIVEINEHTAICTYGDKSVVGFKIED